MKIEGKYANEGSNRNKRTLLIMQTMITTPTCKSSPRKLRPQEPRPHHLGDTRATRNAPAGWRIPRGDKRYASRLAYCSRQQGGMRCAAASCSPGNDKHTNLQVEPRNLRPQEPRPRRHATQIRQPASVMLAARRNTLLPAYFSSRTVRKPACVSVGGNGHHPGWWGETPTGWCLKHVV